MKGGVLRDEDGENGDADAGESRISHDSRWKMDDGRKQGVASKVAQGALAWERRCNFARHAL